MRKGRFRSEGKIDPEEFLLISESVSVTSMDYFQCWEALCFTAFNFVCLYRGNETLKTRVKDVEALAPEIAALNSVTGQQVNYYYYY